MTQAFANQFGSNALGFEMHVSFPTSKPKKSWLKGYNFHNFFGTRYFNNIPPSKVFALFGIVRLCPMPL